VWQNTSSQHLIDGFKGDGIENGAYLNRYLYKNIDVDFVVGHALGRGSGEVVFDGGSIGTVRIPRHNLAGKPMIFRNMNIGSFQIDNADGDNAGTYLIDNTNLSCSAIEYESVFPGTRVVIDGAEC
jgi:hypothetical protein